MWELLLQLRVVLPYLARLVPLLDRGILKAAPDLTELTKGVATMQTSSRDLEVQARNQALQLERIEQQMGRLRVVHENSIEESRKLVAEISALRRVFLTMSIVMAVLLGATVAMVDLSANPVVGSAVVGMGFTGWEEKSGRRARPTAKAEA